MTVSLRGTSGWTSGAPSWPAGTSQGDVAFLLTLMAQSSYYSTSSMDWMNRPSAWSQRFWKTFADNTGRLEVYTLTVPSSTSGLLVVPEVGAAGPATIAQLLVVFTNAAGVGSMVSGTGRVSVPAYGAALITGLELGSAWDIEYLDTYDPSLTELAASSGGKVLTFWGANNTASTTYKGSTTVDRDVWAFPITPAAAPSKPTITAPAQSAGVPTGEDVPVTFVHNTGVAGGSMKAYRLRVRQNAGTWYYWNQSAGTLSSTTAVDNTASGTTVTVTLPNAVVTGATVELIAETQEAVDDQRSPVSDTRTFTRVSPPTVVVTGPGALTGDFTPTVTWVTTVGTGVQETYRAVFTDPSSNVLHDSGTVSGADDEYTAPASTAWTSGQTVTATVTVTQTGGAEADDSDTFSISWTPPTAPTLTATAASQGVTVVVSTVADRVLRVWRRDGSTDTLLGTWETGTDNTLTLVDVFGPRSAVTYVAQVWSDSDGVLLPSAQATSAQVTRTDGDCFYLASGRDPVQTWQAVEIREEGDRTHVRPVSTVWPIGTTFSRTLSGESRGRVGAFTAHATTGVDLDDLVDLLKSGEVLLCWFPPEPHSDGTSSGYVLPMAVTSEVGESRLAQVPYALRILSWSWAERSTPTVGVSVAPVTHAATLSTVS